MARGIWGNGSIRQLALRIPGAAIGMLLALAFCQQPASAASGPSFKGNGLSGFNGGKVRKLIVPSFTVHFLTRQTGTADSGKGFLANKRNTSSAGMYIDWRNPDAAMLKALTEEAYVSFERQMADVGVDLVPRAQLIESEPYKTINGQTEPLVEENVVSVAPIGMKLYDPSAKIDPKGGFMLGLANSNGKLEADAAKVLIGSLDGVAVARVNVNVSYGTFDSIAYSFTTMDSTTSSASVKFSPVLTIPTTGGYLKASATGATLGTAFESAKLPNGTEFAFPKRNGSLELTSPVSGNIGVATLSNTTTKGEKAALAAVNLLGALVSVGTRGAEGFNTKADRYDANVIPAAFESEAKTALEKITRELAGSIRSAIQ